MPVNLQLPILTPEDALGRLRAWLKAHLAANRRSHTIHQRFQFSINTVIQEVLQELQHQHRTENSEGMIIYQRDPFPNSAPFHDAVWELCGRGIARPALVRSSDHEVRFTGLEFVLTAYGERWVTELSPLEVIPSEHGRFASLLASYAQRFGEAYHSRSQEALTCYQAHAFLACCAMCGAAAEAILLTLAIAKSQDREGSLQEYRRTNGRTRLENRLVAGQNSFIQTQLTTFTALLKYWRDDASHGDETRLTEQEAFTAMLLLLRFSTFGDERWTELTG